MHRHDFYEKDDSTYIYDEGFDEEEVDISEIEEEQVKKHTKTGRLHARRSVDEYLERKRLRERYKKLFDDYFGEDS
jgi:hypothetical protein